MRDDDGGKDIPVPSRRGRNTRAAPTKADRSERHPHVKVLQRRLAGIFALTPILLSSIGLRSMPVRNDSNLEGGVMRACCGVATSDMPRAIELLPHGDLQQPRQFGQCQQTHCHLALSCGPTQADVNLRDFGPGPSLSFSSAIAQENHGESDVAGVRALLATETKGKPSAKRDLGRLDSRLTYLDQCDRRRPICQQCQLASAACFERRHGILIDPSDPASQLRYVHGMPGDLDAKSCTLQTICL